MDKAGNWNSCFNKYFVTPQLICWQLLIINRTSKRSCDTQFYILRNYFSAKTIITNKKLCHITLLVGAIMKAINGFEIILRLFSSLIKLKYLFFFEKLIGFELLSSLFLIFHIVHQICYIYVLSYGKFDDIWFKWLWNNGLFTGYYRKHKLICCFLRYLYIRICYHDRFVIHAKDALLQNKILKL